MTIRKTPTILVVEDDVENRAAMVKVLEGAEYKVLETDNGQQALDIIDEGDIDIMVTDLRLPIMDGVELLKRAKAVEQDIEVIMITGHGTVEIAVEAIKEGAYDFHHQACQEGPASARRRKSRREAISLARKPGITPATESDRRAAPRLRELRDEEYRADGRAGWRRVRPLF